MKNVYNVILNYNIYCGTYTSLERAKQARKIIAEKYHKNIDLIGIYKCPLNKINYCTIKED